MGRTFCACRPLGPRATSNSTFWPSASERKPSAWIDVWWQKRSSPPPSCVMKPKPFASLNHFTEPVAIALLFFHHGEAETPSGPYRESTLQDGRTLNTGPVGSLPPKIQKARPWGDGPSGMLQEVVRMMTG